MITPDHYFIDKEKTFKLEDILNNFEGGLNGWRFNVLKYTNRAFFKHDNPCDCLKSALNCVLKDYERIGKEIKQGICIVEKLDPIDLEIHKKALDPNSYNKIDLVMNNFRAEQYKIFLTDVYKWVIGEVSFPEIESKIWYQIDIFS